MSEYGKPAPFRVGDKVNLAKSTDVSAGVQSKGNLAKSTDVSAGVNSKVNLSKSTGIDRVCVGFVGLGIAILIWFGWVLLGDWLATLLGEKTGFLALNLILLVVVAIKAAWDNFFDVGEGSS